VFKISIGKYLIQVERGSLPSMYPEYRKRALLAEEFEVRRPDRAHCFVSTSISNDWPELVVAQTFSPSVAGFNPGILLVVETKTLFIGAGERLLAYRLDPPRRLWEDTCDTGFWNWSQHGGYVLMAAELELAAWNSHGEKLWTTFVEPPWEFRVEGDRVNLDVMGRKSNFILAEGPEQT
jgi:hypothetical protein